MPCASLLPLQVTSIRLAGLPLRRANQHPTGQGRLQRSVELLALESQLVLLLQRERQEDAAPDDGGQAVLRCAGGGLCSVLSGNIRGRGGGGGLVCGSVLGFRGGEAHGCGSDGLVERRGGGVVVVAVVVVAVVAVVR